MNLLKDIHELDKSFAWIDIKVDNKIAQENKVLLDSIGFPSFFVKDLEELEELAVLKHEEKDGLQEITAMVYGNACDYKLDLYDKLELFDPYRQDPELDVIELVSQTLEAAKREAEDLIKTELNSLIMHTQKIVERYM